MTLTGLQTFLAIVETGSLARASERLNVTQSTVTARLQALEAMIGQPLLLRLKTGAQLTPAGTAFKRYAEAIVGLWRQACDDSQRPADIAAVCNIGAHLDLWPGIGRRLFELIREGAPATAVSAWPGGQSDLDRWLGIGLINLALGYQPFGREGQTTEALFTERLVLVSTRPGAPSRFDPGYIYVEGGEEFARQHAAAYADAATARVSFGCAVWALEHLAAAGGSAYLPERLAAPLLGQGRLHRVADAPAFTRTAYMVTNDAAAAGWPWLAKFRGLISSPVPSADEIL
ncbi:MAG: LysR family transcriptional regulator [Pikeienuella sp.]